MIEYIRAKTAEYQTTLGWIEGELRKLQSEKPEHSQLISGLISKMDEPKDILRKLVIISSLDPPRYIARAKTFIHEIQFWVIVLTYHYLPALHKEKAEDIGFRNLLLDISNRVGLSWIKDILVRLDGGHATLSVFDETPIFIAPPQQYVSLIDAPGIYHEFGHNTVCRFKNIIQILLVAVNNYYHSLQQKAGPLSPAQQKERQRFINAAIDYWDDMRLEELFCDIYATYVSGPAHYYSCVDMALREERDPYEVNFGDEHPPLAARVIVCKKGLPSTYDQCRLVGAINNFWSAHIANFNSNSYFDLICIDDLLDDLTNVAIGAIQQYLPHLRRFDEQIANLMSNSNGCSSLEEILNVGTNLLLTQPHLYHDWEIATLTHLNSRG